MKSVTGTVKRDTVRAQKNSLLRKRSTKNKIRWSIIAEEHHCKGNVQRMLGEITLCRSNECISVRTEIDAFRSIRSFFFYSDNKSARVRLEYLSSLN